MIRDNCDLKSFILSHQHLFCKHYPSAVDVSTSLSSVENDILFGFLEGDIEVPEFGGIDHPHNTEFTIRNVPSVLHNINFIQSYWASHADTC